MERKVNTVTDLKERTIHLTTNRYFGEPDLMASHGQSPFRPGSVVLIDTALLQCGQSQRNPTAIPIVIH
jgi:hypothetical protein